MWIEQYMTLADQNEKEIYKQIEEHYQKGGEKVDLALEVVEKEAQQIT